MLTVEAVKALQQGAAIDQSRASVECGIGDTLHAIVALPDDFKVHDLEHVLASRRRARGTMTTDAVTAFALYTQQHAEAGCAVFIDKNNMKATAVLNLGTQDAPGQTDNRAVLALDKTAPFSALLQIANGQPRKQTDVAEFLEDWEPFISCKAGDEEISTRQAAAAVRRITIEAMRKAESSEQQLGATRSTFESVQASSAEKLPTQLSMVIDPPYAGLAPRNFTMRLSVIAGDKPALVLRMIRLEDAFEQMAEEFAELVASELNDGIPVMLGSYQCTR